MSFQALSGNLRKLGEKGPRKSWKKRFFRQKEDYPNRIYYYVSEKSPNEQGFINLESAIGVLRTSESSFKKNYCFQVNTPTRIYYLQADSDKEVDYWIDGIAKILRELSNEQSDSQLTLELEQMNNRIKDLELEVTRYRKALQLASTELNLSPVSVLQCVEQGISSLKGILTPLEKNSFENNLDEAAKAEQTHPPESEALQTKEQQNESKPQKIDDPPSLKTDNSSDTKQEDSESTSEQSDDESVILSTFCATVLFEYGARKPYELSLVVDETITVISKHENGWWLGCNAAGDQGYFPASYVRPIEEEVEDD